MGKRLQNLYTVFLVSIIGIGLFGIVLFRMGDPLGTTILSFLRGWGGLFLLGIGIVLSLFSSKEGEGTLQKALVWIFVLLINWGIWHSKASGLW